ncbi:prolyl oligopeptidase family serine peptidase [bacterium]|nr:prolyl oligopeptidase family serine peptidase [bacterium]
MASLGHFTPATLLSPLFVFLVFLTAGCFSYGPGGAVDAAIPRKSAAEIDAFSYDRAADINARLTGTHATREGYVVHELKWDGKDFPRVREQHGKGYFFAPNDKSRKYPALVVIPPTGGPYDMVVPFGDYFAERGFVVIGLRRRESYFTADKDMEQNRQLMQQGVVDVRRALDYLETLEYVDRDRVAVMGISLGGILGALAMESDGRIKAAAFVVSAAHLPELVITSGYTRVGELRDAMMREANVGLDELPALARREWARVDPASYADRLDPARIVMVNGAFDDIVTRPVVMRTWETYGRPRLHFLPCGHYTMMFWADRANRKIHEHFVEVLDLPPSSS